MSINFSHPGFLYGMLIAQNRPQEEQIANAFMAARGASTDVVPLFFQKEQINKLEEVEAERDTLRAERDALRKKLKGLEEQHPTEVVGNAVPAMGGAAAAEAATGGPAGLKKKQFDAFKKNLIERIGNVDFNELVKQSNTEAKKLQNDTIQSYLKTEVDDVFQQEQE